jgi:hypothetical protein
MIISLKWRLKIPPHMHIKYPLEKLELKFIEWKERERERERGTINLKNHLFPNPIKGLTHSIMESLNTGHIAWGLICRYCKTKSTELPSSTWSNKDILHSIYSVIEGYAYPISHGLIQKQPTHRSFWQAL